MYTESYICIFHILLIKNNQFKRKKLKMPKEKSKKSESVNRRTQYNGLKRKDTIQWPKEKGKKKDL